MSNFYQGLLFLHGHIADPRVLTGSGEKRETRATPHRVATDAKRKGERKSPVAGAARAAC